MSLENRKKNFSLFSFFWRNFYKMAFFTHSTLKLTATLTLKIVKAAYILRQSPFLSNLNDDDAAHSIYYSNFSVFFVLFYFNILNIKES